MAVVIGHFLRHSSEWSKAREAPSSLVPHALEQLDAAIWLIAGSRHSQAVILLHTAIELLLKSELERLHPLLVVDRVDYKLLKSLLREELKQHPHVKVNDLNELDLDRTITFWEAFVRVTDIYPDLKSWEPGMRTLQQVRNQIVHHRGDASPAYFVNLICLTALPFIECFAQRSAQIDIGKLLGDEIYREVCVARRLCEAFEARGEAPCEYALQTVRTAVIYQDVYMPAPFDENGGLEDESDREYRIGECLLRDAQSSWPGLIVPVDCKICGSMYAYAGVDLQDEVIVDQEPHSLACAQCGLWITHQQRGLAAAHFGMIPALLIEKALDQW